MAFPGKKQHAQRRARTWRAGTAGGGGKVREGVRGQVMMLLRDLLWSLDTGLWANGSSAEH